MKKPKIDWTEATKAIEYAYDQGAITSQTRARFLDFIEDQTKMEQSVKQKPLKESKQ